MAILVAYDGSSPARTAVKYAVTEHGDEEIILFRVVEAAGSSTEAGINLAKEKLKDQEETAGETAEEVDDLLDTAGVEFRIETSVGQPVEEIVAFADEHDVDQIIVGNHGRDGVSRVLLGSVAEKTVRRAPIPVTVVR